MDKEFYQAELLSVMERLVSAQQMAILRGEQLIMANDEIMKLKQELHAARVQGR